MIRVVAPGRVNLVGDHTDTTGGLALPCAIDRSVTVEFDQGGDVIEFRSDSQDGVATVALPASPLSGEDAGAPTWVRTVRAAAHKLQPATGGTGVVRSTVPIGVGLSSSAAFTIGVLLALGFDGSREELALVAQAVEHEASNVPCGLLDQLAIVYGAAGAALRVDTTELSAPAVPVPSGAAIVVVPSGEARSLTSSPYALRRAEAGAADEQVGGLRSATLTTIRALRDPVLKRRARHVVSENLRVDEMVSAFWSHDLAAAGAVMLASHASLRDDFEVSTETLDALVEALVTERGVYGARLTGAGFGGCAVALVAGDTAAPIAEKFKGWVITPSAGARLSP